MNDYVLRIKKVELNIYLKNDKKNFKETSIYFSKLMKNVGYMVIDNNVVVATAC